MGIICVYKSFKIKTFTEYRELYPKSNTLFLDDVFEIFRKMHLTTYHLNPIKFPSAAGITLQATLKKADVKLESLTYIDMILMVELVLEEEFVSQLIDMKKLIISI